MKRLGLAIAIGTLFAGSALAQPGTAQREVDQQDRIVQGLNSGQLTTKEATRLEAGQARVRRDQARALRAGIDGHVDVLEQRNIRAAENQAAGNRESPRIYCEKHDDQQD